MSMSSSVRTTTTTDTTTSCASTKQSTNTTHDHSLSQLILELQYHILSYLSYKDAISLTKHFTEWGIRVASIKYDMLPNDSCLEWIGDTVTGDQPLCTNLPLPVPNTGSSPVHSMVLHFAWYDQGWGNRKGCLYIVASKKGTHTYTSVCGGTGKTKQKCQFGGGRLVCSTGPASHKRTDGEMSFTPREFETYTLWYSCGSGGGHSLCLDECFLHTYVLNNIPQHM